MKTEEFENMSLKRRILGSRVRDGQTVKSRGGMESKGWRIFSWMSAANHKEEGHGIP